MGDQHGDAEFEVRPPIPDVRKPDDHLDTTDIAGDETGLADADALGDGGIDAGGTEVPGAEVGPADFGPCDDGNPCTIGDYWYAQSCISGSPYVCDDGIDCTSDQCDGTGGCKHPLMPDRCFIAGKCYADGAVHPSDPCRSCVSPISSSTWTPDDGKECDDGFFCTVGDHCSNGLCVGVPKDCEDGNICTTDGCEEGKGCLHVANERSCEDGNICTLGDTCLNGSCQAGKVKLDCNDSNPCTVDKCNPLGGCEHTASSVQPCNDGNPCTVGDLCTDGECTPGPALDCEDDNPCTDNYCGPTGDCVTIPNSTGCDDGNACTAGDLCSGGSCLPGGLLLPCNDGNPCTTDSCDAQVGCLHVVNVLPCDDGSLCTENDYCYLGTCVGGNVVVSCADGNPCTDDFCEPSGDCVHLANLAGCEDGDFCTSGDFCTAGECQSGPKWLLCDDGSPCTQDSCLSDVGCVHEPVDAFCSDGNPCTVGDECVLGTCVPGTSVLACDDGNVCTDDWCDPAGGCVHTANSNPCSDDDGCTVDDVCAKGSCIGKATECDDGNECTKDSCAAGGVCKFEPVASHQCRPTIEITSPPRGAELLGPPDEVLVEGHVSSPGGPIVGLEVDGKPAALDDQGEFSVFVYPTHGMNIVTVHAEDALGVSNERVRAFYFSHLYRSGDPAGKQTSQVDDGLLLGLGQAVLDDDDDSTLDDVAAVALQLVKGYDLNKLLAATYGGNVWGVAFEISVDSVQFAPPSIDLKLVDGGLDVDVSVKNVKVTGMGSAGRIEVCVFGVCLIQGWLFSAPWEVSMQEVFVSMHMSIGFLEPSGAVVELIPGQSSCGFVGFDAKSPNLIMDGLVYLFEGTIKSTITEGLQSALTGLPKALADALNGISVDETLLVPALLANAAPVPVSLKTSLSSLSATEGRLHLGLGAGVASKKGTTHDSPGAIARSGCLGTSPEVGKLPKDGELAFGLSDDVLNELLFEAWWGGAFEGPLKGDIMAGAKGNLITAMKEKLGIELKEGDLQAGAEVDFLLPPIVIGCGETWPVQVQVGDARLMIWVDISAGPLKGSGTLTAYLSMEAPLTFAVVEWPGGQTLSAFLDGAPSIWWDVEVDLGGILAQLKEPLLVSVEGELDKVILQDIPAQALTSIAWPTIPLDTLHPSVPSGTALGVDGTGVKRLPGITEVHGDVVQVKSK